MTGIPRRSTGDVLQRSSPPAVRRIASAVVKSSKTLSMLAVAKSEGGIDKGRPENYWQIEADLSRRNQDRPELGLWPSLYSHDIFPIPKVEGLKLSVFLNRVGKVAVK
jgi:hypothetical protein